MYQNPYQFMGSQAAMNPYQSMMTPAAPQMQVTKVNGAGGANALAIMSISDNFVTGAKSTTEERETSFTNMMKLALETAIR